MTLSAKDSTYYAEMQRTFETPGWENLRVGWQTELDSLSNAVFFNAKSMDDMYTARVRYGLLHELLNLPASLEAQHTALLEANEDE